MELNQVLELTKTAIRKNLVRWDYKGEQSLIEALNAIESFQKQQPDQIRIRTRWQCINECGYPPKDNDQYYGKRYSVPVMVGNETTGQVAIVAYMWDYTEEGWVEATLCNGPYPGDYEVQYVSHWAMWPKCKLVCLD